MLPFVTPTGSSGEDRPSDPTTGKGAREQGERENHSGLLREKLRAEKTEDRESNLIAFLWRVHI